MMDALRRINALRGLVMFHDLVMVAAAWIFAFLLRYDFQPPGEVWNLLAWSTPLTVMVFGLSFRWARLYAGIWRYASIPDLVRIARAVIAGNLVMLAILFLTVRADDMPRSVLFINPLLLGVLMFIQTRLNPQTSDNPQAKIMMNVMPIMFTGMMLFLPSGLVLYIFVNTLLGITQQYLILNKITADPAKA